MTPPSRGTRTSRILGFITRQIVSIARAWTQERRVIFIARKQTHARKDIYNTGRRLQGRTLEARNHFQGASLLSWLKKYSGYNLSSRVVAFVFSGLRKLKLSVSARTLAIFAVVLVLAPAGALSFGFLNNDNTQAAPGINDAINFQARLLTSGGGLVPDGNYNVEFRIYQDGDGDLGGGDETLQWTEAHLNNNSQGVRVANGYLSAQLGNITSLSSVDFNQDTLWLSVNIGDTNGTCTPFSNCNGDGEMDPFMRFTATPYSFNSDELDGLDSTDFVQLGQNATPQAINTTNSAIAVNQTGSGNLIQLQDGGTDRFVIADGGATTLTGSLTVSSTGVFQGSSVTIGTTSQQGDVILHDGDGETGTIRVASLGSNEIYILPDSDGSDTICLVDLANCGDATVTLQDAYDNGQTILTDDDEGNLAFTIAEATSHIINITGTGSFAVQDTGTNVLEVTDDSTTTITNADGGSDVALTVNGGASTGDALLIQDGGVEVFSVADGGAATFTNPDGADVALTVNGGTSTGNILDIQDNGAIVLSVADGGNLLFGSAGDTNLYRSNTDELTTDDSLVVANQFDAGGNVFTVNATGSLGITLNPGEDNARIAVDTSADTNRGIIVRANSATQSANLTEWQDGDGDEITSISAAGVLQFADGSGAAADTNLYRSAANTLATNDNFTLDNNADSTLTLTLDSGSTATQAASIDFSDQGDVKWILTKSSSNNFAISDQDNSINRIFLNQGGATEFRTGDDSSAFSFLNGSSEDLVTILSDGNLQFEGDTPDGFETTLQVVDPTADITYRLPDAAAGTYDICTTAVVCSGYGASAPTLQVAYDNGQTILTDDDEGDLAFTIAEATNFITNITGTGRFAVQHDGTDVLAVNDGGIIDVDGDATFGSGFQLFVDDGDAANPGIAFQNDTDTGIYGDGSDTISFTTGGSNRLTVADSLATFASGVDITVNGEATFQNDADSTTAFEVLNSDGTSLLNVDTSTTNNLLSNGGFENGTTGWAAKGAGSIAQDSTYQWEGNDSLAVTTTAAADDGAEYDYTFTASTQYTLSFYARLASGSMTTLDIGHDDNGADIDECTGNTLSNSGWTHFSCTFTTGGTIGGGSNIYINQSDATARTFYIDGVTLEQAATTGPYQNGTISLNGVIDSPLLLQNQEDSTEALVVKDTSNNNLIQVDTLNGGVEFDQKLQVGGGGGTVNQCISIVGLYSCDAALEAYESSTTTTALNIIGTNSVSQLLPSGASAANVYGSYSIAIAGDLGADNLTGTVVGALGQAWSLTTGTADEIIGGSFGSGNLSTGTVTDLIGVQGSISQTTAGTITTGTGVNVVTPNITAGTLTTYRGVNVNNGAGVTNYGILVADQTGGSTSDYGIAIEGADTYALWVGSGGDNTDAANGITFGQTAGTSANLYRSDDNQLRTDDAFIINTATDAQNAFSVTGDAGQVIRVDSEDDVVYLGASALAGNLGIWDGTSNYVAIVSGNQTGNYSIAAPDNIGQNDTFCLLTENNCNIDSSVTLQDAYDNGNNITTTDARDIEFDLADTTTDADFIVDILGTGNTFEVRDAGSASLTVADGGATTIRATDGGSAVALTVNNGTSTGNILEVQDNGTTVLSVADGGNLLFGSAGDTNLYRSGTSQLTSDGGLVLDGVADAVQLSVQAHSTQNANIFNVLGTSGQNHFRVEGDGDVIVGDSTTGGVFRIADGSSNFITINAGSQSNDRTISLPDNIGQNDTFCLQTEGNCDGNIDLQDAYDNGNNITTTDARDIEFDLADTTTDADFIVDLLGTGNTLEVRDAGTAVFTVADGGATTVRATDGGSAVALTVNNGTSTGNVLNVQDNGTNVFTVADGGATTFQNTTDSAAGFRILDSGGGTSIFNVDTDNERIGVGVDAPTAKLEVENDDAAAANVVLRVEAAASQTGNLVEIQNSDDEDLLVVEDNGAIKQSINTDPEGLGNIEAGLLLSAPHFNGGRRVEVVGNIAYFTGSFSNSLSAFDISDPSSPTLISTIRDADNGSYNLDGAFGLSIRGQYAYVTSQTEDALVIIDISDPGNMQYVGDITDADASVELDQAVYVSVVGSYAYVASKTDDSISIIDISDPTNPTGVGFICDDDDDGASECIGSATTLANPEAVDVVGNIAYATSLDDNGISIIDVSDPSNPNEIGSVTDSTISTITSPTDIEIDGKYAYVSAASDNAVTILDVTDASSITSVGSVTDATNLNTAQGITLAGNYAYVAAYSGDRVAVVDVSDVTSPAVVGTILDSDANVSLHGVWHTNVYDNKLFVASFGTGLGEDAALSIIDLGGAELTSANIGSLKVNEIEVSSNLTVQQNLDVYSGITVGAGGLFSLGPITNYVAETSTTAGTVQGTVTTVADTGIVTTGTDTTIGSVIDVTRTGATGGTINTTGLDIDVVGDTGGTSTVIGLDVNVSGADTNYAALFQGGNVGIGIAAPTELLHISGGDVLIDRGSDTGGLSREVTVGGAIASGTTSPYARINFQNYDGGADYIGAQIWAVNQGGDSAGAIQFFTSNTATLNTNPALYLENDNRATFNGRIRVDNPDAISTELLVVDGDGSVGSGSAFVQFNNDAVGSVDIRGNGNITTTGDLTAEGGDITIGSSTQAGDLILHDGDGETGTLRVASLGSDEVYILPDSDGSDTICLLDLGNCVGAGTNATLQAAYDAGNNITTTDARDIEFDLADTTTDADFIVDLLGTGNTFEVRDAGTAVLRVADGGSIDLGSITTGINITSTGVISDIDGNIVLGDTVDLGSAATGLNVTTAGVLSDIDGDLAVNDNLVVTGNILPSAASTYDLGSTSAEIQSLFLADNTGINLGLGQDVLIAYDETTDDRLEISGTNADVWLEDSLTVAGHAAIGAEATVDSTTNSALFNCLFSVCDTAGESHTAALLVEEEFTDLNASNDNINVGIQSVVKLTPDADASADHGFGIASTIDVDSSNTEDIFSIIGSQAYARLQGSGNATFHFANSFDGENSATSGTTTIGAGAYGAYSISGGGNVTGGYGVFGSVGSSASGTGDYTDAVGLQGRVLLQASSTTDVTDAYGSRVNVTNNGSGTITDAYGFAVTELEGATNNYGLHVANLSSATTNYGIYVDHAASGTDYGLYVDDAEVASINLASTDNDAASGILFGGDTTLYRSAADTLRTNDSLIIDGSVDLGDASTDTISFNGQVDTGITFDEGADRTLNVEQRASDAVGRSLTVAAGQGGTGAGQAGGALNLQGGAAGGTNANGGNVVLSGGAGAGTGTNGLVVISNPTVSAAATQNCTGTPCTITQANIDSYGSIAITTDATGYTVELSDPSITTAGRLIYITNADTTDDFTLSANGGAETITLKPGTTATMIWGGSDWTAAGASSSTDLQAAYDNTAASAGAAELVLNAPGGNADGLTIRNNATTPIEGGLLEVQASIGNNLFAVNNFGTEYAANGGAEDDTTFTTDWTAVSGTTITRETDSGDVATGLASVEVAGANGLDDGVTNNLATALSTTPTQYQISFTGKLDSGPAFSTLEVIYTPDGGSTEIACTNYSTQELTTTEWSKVTCDITSDATAVSDADLIIRQSDNPAGTRVFHIDNLSIRENSSSSTPPNVQIGGGENGGAVTLFTLDQASSPPVASGDSTYYGSMYYDTVTGRIQCYEADGWGACGSPPNNIITITPEYAGAVLNGSGVGTMSADFCSNDAQLSVNSTLCDSGEAVNYYEWTSPQATAQTYSIYLTFQLPTTFDGFIDNDTITLDARTTNTGNSDVDYQVFRSTGSDVTECGSSTTVTSSDDTWQTVSHNGDESSTCSFAAGDRVIFKINMVAQDNDSVYVSDINFTYTNE